MAAVGYAREMESESERPTAGISALQDGISAYLTSIESGNYRRTVQSVLDSWQEWATSQREIESVEDVEILDCRHYARSLKQQAREGEMKASTARTYYAIVRAFLGFCVDEEVLASNPAAVKRAVDELPEETGDVARQFWGQDERTRFLAFVDERARETLEGEGDATRETAFRDRALVYVLALSGVRSGEVFSDPADSKRNGVRWSDLDLDSGTLRVFGKSREYEYAQVPADAVEVLDRYRRVLDPPSGEWPLFPSKHAPSLYRTVREQLPDCGVPDADVESMLDDSDVSDIIREYELTPPALSKNGARSIVETLCEEAGIEIDGEPLKLHGARRGLGHELYREGYAELAQSALRHSSIEVTHDSYSDIQASETAEKVGDVLDGE